jgi:transposase-like protein
MPDTTTATRWRAVVEAHAASGLTIRDFARQHGVNASSLAWWRSRLRNSDLKQTPTTAPPVFSELTVAPEATASPELRRALVVSFGSRQVSVVVDDQTDLTLLRRLADALA